MRNIKFVVLQVGTKGILCLCLFL